MKPRIGTKFKDKFNDIWIYIGTGKVRRERDRNIGIFDNGQGLERIYD